MIADNECILIIAKQEYYLQQTLEEAAPSLEPATKLLNIPEDAEAVFSERNRDSLDANADHTLFKLAAEMERLDSNAAGLKDGFGLSDSSASLSTPVLTDADRLLQSAVTLTPTKTTTQEEAHDVESALPKYRWAKLKAATAVLGAASHDNNSEEVSQAFIVPNGGDNEDDNLSVSEDSETGSSVLDDILESAVKADLRDFESWVRLRGRGAFYYARVVLFYVVIPSLVLAAILFYGADNPPCGASGEGCRAREEVVVSGNESVDSIVDFFRGSRFSRTSISYWVLFLGARQVLTCCFAHIAQAFIVGE